ncbi:MAG TPA: DUF4307 domain-containing protein [Micromonosporaceae bacterium]
MTPTSGPPVAFPPGRYGRRRDPARQRRRRWVTSVLAAVVVLAGLAIAVKLYRQYTLSPYQVHITSVTNLTDSEVTVTFEVTVPEGSPAVCTVLAHTRDGELVGRAEVPVPAPPAGRRTAKVTYTLATTKRPVTGEVPGCGPTR